MAKKPEDRQIAFRARAELHERLERTAEGLGLEISSLLRLILTEHLHEYEERVHEIERKRNKE